MTVKRISKSMWIGWAVTIILSVTGGISGAYVTINARVYELEKQIELVKLDQTNMKLEQTDTRAMVKEVREMFMQIDKQLTEITGQLNLKADKKFIQ